MRRPDRGGRRRCVALDTTGAYAAVSAGLGDVTVSPVAVTHLAAIAAGTPLAAAGAGWLLAGREPAAIAKQPIE